MRPFLILMVDSGLESCNHEKDIRKAAITSSGLSISIDKRSTCPVSLFMSFPSYQMEGRKAIGLLNVAKYQLDPNDPTFVQVLNCVMFDTSLSMGARLTYAALVEHNRDNASCWPSMERLGTMVGVCARTIQNYIKELVAKGLVTVIKRGCWKSANEYRLNALVPPVAAKESQVVTRQDMRNPGVGDTRNRTSVQPYPTNKSINNWKKRAGEAGALAFMRRRGIKI